MGSHRFIDKGQEMQVLNIIYYENNLDVNKLNESILVALVAKGEIDIAVSFSKKNDWDLAAADLIIKEAGGNLKDLNGNDIYYNKASTKIKSVLACNSSIINNLTNLFNK